MPERKENSGDSGGSGSTAPTVDSQAAPDKSVVLPLLVPPSEEEAQAYYYGLLSRPRLVGRTSAGVILWKLPPPARSYVYDGANLPEICVLSPIGGPHRALQLIEGVLPQLKDAVHVLPWTSLDVFRIGSSKVAWQERPVTLWVGVRDVNEIKWDNVALALRQVRCVLDSVGLPEIECEIREGRTAPLAPSLPLPIGPPPAFAPVVKETFSGEWRAKLGVSTSLGQTIIPSHPAPKFIEGTLGVYLRPARKPHAPIWALTCRHVCLPLEYHENKRYTRPRPDGGYSVYSPSDTTLNDAIEEVEDCLEAGQVKLRDLEEKGLDQLTRPEHAKYVVDIEAIRRTLSLLRSMRPWDNRRIGSVLYSPAIAAPLGPDGVKRWTRDWCLVHLRDEKFPPGDTKNLVDLRVTSSWRLNRGKLQKFLDKNCRLPENFALPEHGLLPITGVVPMAELEWISSGKADRKVPFWCDPNIPAADKKAEEIEALKRAPPMRNLENDRILVVGKRGRTTGLTWGAASEFRSVVRTPFGSTTFESRELAIVGSLDNKKKPFSDKGDSGALVFDVTGRAVGIMTSGTDARLPVFDVTYCTPMELVLADVSKELGEEVVLL